MSICYGVQKAAATTSAPFWCKCISLISLIPCNDSYDDSLYIRHSTLILTVRPTYDVILPLVIFLQLVELEQRDIGDVGLAVHTIMIRVVIQIQFCIGSGCKIAFKRDAV